MDGGEKMNGKPGKNTSLIIYLLSSAAVVTASISYFLVSGMKENKTTITIDKSVTTTAVSAAAPENSGDATIISSAPATSPVHTASAEAAEPATEIIYLDINSATHEELVKLKGIGDALADAIIRYREEHGGFRNIEEIIEVSGIGENIFSDIAGHIYVPYPVYDDEVTPEEDYPEPEPELPQEHQPTLEELAPININTADIPELMLLPHVDEDIARKIIKLREDINNFGNTYELAYVKGLSKSQVNDILPYVTIE